MRAGVSLIAILALSGLAAPEALAQAAVPAAVAEPAVAVSSGPEAVSVVIYRDRPVNTVELMRQSQQSWSRLDREGLALIVETRTVDLPAGEAVIRFEGVAGGIVGQSAVLEGLPAGVIERNTDFDLLTPGSLFERSIGETVRVVRINPVTGGAEEHVAVIRAGANGPVLEVDGGFEALSCSGLTQRVVFDRVPEGLSDQPSLSVRTRAGEAGRYTVTLAYLATGLQWSSDYVAELAPDGRSMTLTGWLTLANFGSTGFVDAPVQAVAGNLRTESGTVPVDAVRLPRRAGCWPQDTTTEGEMPEYSGPAMAVPPPPPPPAPPPPPRLQMRDEVVVTGSRIAEQGELGDYKIYTLPERTTVAARQTKQVRFLERRDVPVERIYRARIDGSSDLRSVTGPLQTDIVLRLDNDADSALGLALPGGTWSLRQQRTDGPAFFTGEARSTDRPIGLPVELSIGQSPNVRVRYRTTDYSSSQTGGVTTTLYTVQVEVMNAGAEAASLEVIPWAYFQPGFTITRESRESSITEGGYPAWSFAVPAGSVERLSFSYRVEY
ncbi:MULTISPECIES: DUF4139 domain-containing protein [unclassified Brevundimonas]|jgi:hypothetical protein|uniref:DUF4139 domain-containing protein n=1 Tax=unclassified Brevundimonas TaxID=2622653 RepID=UPI000C596983|nr:MULTISPECIES: hypothetical protein [unclassified Brevundimonas]MAL87699.1 hypothetical protein [Brevundimonas sp.]|tara:strand:- start:6203 stop:7855 length:1653 start_codon:yes stop_codon:yes gene_type:complete